MLKALGNIHPQSILFSRLAKGLCTLGVVVRIVIWWQQRSISMDEANLIRNWVEQSFLALWGHLEYEQYAPPLYSTLNKTVLLLLGNTELTTRLIPLLCSMLALYFFYKIGKGILSPLALCLAVFFMAFGGIFLQYATECKQYSSDSMIALLLVYQAFRTDSKAFSLPNSLFWALGGMIAIWSSMPAVFVLSGIGLYFLWENRRRQKALWPIGTMILFWLLHFGLYFFLILKSEAQSDYLQDFHARHFLAFPPSSMHELALLGEQSMSFISFAIGKTVVSLLLCLLGLILAFWKVLTQQKTYFFLFLLPIVATLCASAFGYYSLIGRLIVFFIPFLILLIFLGMDRLFSIGNIAITALLLLLFLVPMANRKPLAPFYSTFHTDFVRLKDGLLYVHKKQQKGDVLFAYYNTAPVVRYYTQHHDKALSFEQIELQDYPCCDTDIIEQDITQLVSAGQQRIWVLYDLPDADFLKKHIESQGGTVREEFRFYKGVVFLADFKGQSR